MNRFDKYIDKFLKWLVPSIFFVPFVVNADFYFPFITPRNFLFRIIVTIVLSLYLYLYFRHKEKYSFGRNKLLIAYFAFTLILTVSSLLAGDFWYSFWSNYERMEGLLGLYYLIALLVVILGLYRSKKAWLGLLRVSVWASLLMSIMALSQHWNVNLYMESAGGERVTGTTGNATYLAVYTLFNLFFALYLLFKDKNRRPKLELCLFYILDILLIGFEIFGSGKGILAGIFGDFRIFLLFVIPQIFVNIYYYFYQRNRTIRYSLPAYFILIFLLNFVALFDTQTRGVLVGMFVAAILVAIFLLFSRYVNKKFKYYVASALMLIVLFTSGIFIFKNTSLVQANDTLRRVSSISISDTTTETRLLTWQLSLRAAKEKPILGWGEEKFYVVFNKYFPNEIFKDRGSRVWFDRPHNVFLQELVAGGILGLLAYLAIFWFAFKNLWKHYKNTHDPITISIMGALLVSYLVQNFFVFDSLNSYILLIVFLAVSIFLAGDIDKKSLSVGKPNNILAIGSFLLVLMIGYGVNIPQMTTNHDFIVQYDVLRTELARNKYQKEDLDKLLGIIDRQYFGKFELRQVYTEFVPSLMQAQILSPTDTKYFVDKAEEEMLKSIDEQPDNVRHHSFLLNLYLYTASLDPLYAQKAVDLIENKAIPLSPTRVQLYYSLGQAYMNLGDTDKAVHSFMKARALAPQVFDSYYNLIFTYLSISDFDSAQASLEDLYDNVPNMVNDDYVRLAALYNYFDRQDDVDKIINNTVK